MQTKWELNQDECSSCRGSGMSFWSLETGTQSLPVLDTCLECGGEGTVECDGHCPQCEAERADLLIDDEQEEDLDTGFVDFSAGSLPFVVFN